MGDVNWWKMTKPRISTNYIIARDGTIYEVFDPKYYGFHTGLGANIDKHTVSIEIDSWGHLEQRNGAYYSYTGELVPMSDVIVYEKEHQGHLAFERYTDSQVDATIWLIKDIAAKFNIPLNTGGFWENNNQQARSGGKGVFGHVAYRNYGAKSDPHPQPYFKEKLNKL